MTLPLPRLQLRWEHVAVETWVCHYELLIPLDEYDIRNVNGAGNLSCSLGKTNVTSTRGAVDRDGTLSTPFRDGAHAKWDSARLGIPAFVVYGEQSKALVPELPSPMECA